MAHEQHCHCCPQAPAKSDQGRSIEFLRREFLGSMVAGGVLLGGLQWDALAADSPGGELLMPPKRKPVVALPILVHDLPVRQEMISWRNWGGVDSMEAAHEEMGRITGELHSIKDSADFPFEFLDVIRCTNIDEFRNSPLLEQADVLIIYGAGFGFDSVKDFGKEVIIFQRWKSGPVYLSYEVGDARFLRQHTDQLALKNITFDDVVTDSLDELTWRLRSFCGLKNTKGTRILAIGQPDIWAHSQEDVKTYMADLKDQFQIDVQNVSFEELAALIASANEDPKMHALAERRAVAYLASPGTSLETKREYVVNCFMLDQVFRALMKRADCHAITILGCMGTIMPMAKTSACLTLSTLNDDGYLAFCESDFAVIPSGILLANISGLPVFLNDPTYPHDNIITLAHCTAPRKMDGKNYEPTRLVTHFESDFGAAPKVDFKLGEWTTNIAPDFKLKRWVGFLAEVVDNPFRPICRSQIDVRYRCSDALVAAKTPGFHWMLSYGDYLKETGYALRRLGVAWENLDEVPTVNFG